MVVVLLKRERPSENKFILGTIEVKRKKGPVCVSAGDRNGSSLRQHYQPIEKPVHSGSLSSSLMRVTPSLLNEAIPDVNNEP
ncbi:unnamed protein product [Allacma fusca]|uniref:Uncharacterized protein n=1 Tax=Allacma fusca TaxID=39272 RepID=A0A8J2PU08_9HEXA|nr:unnamed protein product [Allacma fusca]